MNCGARRAKPAVCCPPLMNAALFRGRQSSPTLVLAGGWVMYWSCLSPITFPFAAGGRALLGASELAMPLPWTRPRRSKTRPPSDPRPPSGSKRNFVLSPPARPLKIILVSYGIFSPLSILVCWAVTSVLMPRIWYPLLKNITIRLPRRKLKKFDPGPFMVCAGNKVLQGF